MTTDHWYPTGTLAEPYLPQEVTDVELAFPAYVGKFLPPANTIPNEFCTLSFMGRGQPEWCEIVNQWFAKGLPAEVEFYPVEGIDPELAFRHLRAIMGSYEPKHEYKVAAVAYLLSLWFTQVKGWK